MKKILFHLLLIIASTLGILAQGKVEVISEKANLRGTPNQSGKVVAEVAGGDTFELIKKAGPWFLVQTPDYVGWLHGNTIKLLEGDSTLMPATIAPRYLPRSPAREAVAPAPTYPVPQTEYPSRNYILGPRGGCYYYGGTGRKVYVDHSLCH